MNLQTEFDKIISKLLLGLLEASIVTIISIMSLTASVIMYFLRRYIYSLLGILGINYFKERNKAIRDINSDLIWCMGALRADSYCMFRTYNGRAYITEEISPHKSNPNLPVVSDKKITVKKVNSKPEEFFPNILEQEIYNSIIQLSVSNDWKLISYDFIKATNPNNPLIIFLEEQGIDHLLSYRIWDMNTKTFGIIFFTWGFAPNLDDLFDRKVSKKLDSISIRFQNYIVSSILEKVLNLRYIR